MSRTSSKGTIWVVAQCALIGLTGVGWVLGPRVNSLMVPGTVLAVAGGVLAFWAAFCMGTSTWTFFPNPRKSGQLITGGPFRFVRHPIYAGALTLNLGQSLMLGLWGIPPTVALGLLWYWKSRLEERLMAERFPEYSAYAEQVTGRLIPGVL